MGQAKLRGTFEERKAAAIPKRQEAQRLRVALRMVKDRSSMQARMLIMSLAALGKYEFFKRTKQ